MAMSAKNSLVNLKYNTRTNCFFVETFFGKPFDNILFTWLYEFNSTKHHQIFICSKFHTLANSEFLNIKIFMQRISASTIVRKCDNTDLATIFFVVKNGPYAKKLKNYA